MSYLKFNADYLFTGKEMLDVHHVLITNEHGIVEEIVNTLRESVSQAKQQKTKSRTAKSTSAKKPSAGKSKASRRSRTKKQLS